MSGGRFSRQSGLAPGGADGGDRASSRRIAEVQRARLLSAMFGACAEHGAANVSVGHVTDRARVSRRTFYEIFDNVEECVLAAVDDGVARISAAVLPAWQSDGAWRERIRGSLTELLHALDNDRPTGRLLVVDTLAAGQRTLSRRNDVLAPVLAAVDHGRRESKNGDRLPALTAEGIVGGILSILHARFMSSGWRGASRSRTQGAPRALHTSDRGRRDAPPIAPLIDLTGPLMSMIVLPYLGPAASQRELARPAPKRRSETPLRDDHPLSDIPMRITYRTMRVLEAIASEPGASNRRAGRAAGIDDQGQISKLLSRLVRLGLIENRRDERVRGAPNAWHLTRKGASVHAWLTGPGALATA